MEKRYRLEGETAQAVARDLQDLGHDEARQNRFIEVYNRCIRLGKAGESLAKAGAYLFLGAIGAGVVDETLLNNSLSYAPEILIFTGLGAAALGMAGIISGKGDNEYNQRNLEVIKQAARNQRTFSRSLEGPNLETALEVVSRY